MPLLFLVSIYFFARGVFALFGQPIFYTKRSLELIEEEKLPLYLKKIGWLHLLTGIVFLAKALLDIPFPDSTPILILWLIALCICVVLLAKCNEQYKKKAACDETDSLS